MQNAQAQEKTKSAMAGNHGAIYEPHQINILIGGLRRLHAVAPKV